VKKLLSKEINSFIITTPPQNNRQRVEGQGIVDLSPLLFPCPFLISAQLLQQHMPIHNPEILLDGKVANLVQIE